jgi:hypothetical protein
MMVQSEVEQLLRDWQTDRSEWHGPVTLEVVREYAEWREARTPAVDEGVVEAVALAMAKEIGWGTFSHFDPDDMRRVARAAISAMAHRP